MKRNYSPNYKAAIIILSLVAAIEAIIIVSLIVSRPKKRAVARRMPPPQAVAIKGKIAIVIDDWGYNLNNLAVLRQIRYPLTLAVLPNLPYTKRINQEGNNLGFEIILHLPMEPQERAHLEQNTIMTDMPDKTIRDIVAADLNSVSFAKGASNHMGSVAVKDSRTLSVIFNELSKRGLYFLDSYVASDEAVSGVAANTNIRTARRNVFLDNKEDAEYIKNQIYQLKVKARIYGSAIGIGHDRRLTLQVLKEVMPQLEREGYRFVFVSSLTRDGS